MKNNKIYSVLIGLLLIAATLSACSTGSSAESKFPVGKFISAENKYLAYQLNQDNTWAYLSGAGIGAQGTYEVKGNQWINNGDEACPFPGTYEWSFDGTNLSFKLVG